MPQFNLNQTKYNLHKYAAFLSFAVILLLGVAFLQPFSFTENTNATTERTTNGDYYIETTTTDLNLTINTTPAGTQETASHDVTVRTDDPAGYTLTVSVNNDTSNALNLNGSTSATEKFNATSGTYASPKALDENSWGFADTLAKKNNDQWAAVPLLSNAQQVKQTSSASTSGDTTTVHYAINAKYDGQHSNGNYSNTITYSVVGNTIPVTYMQDLDSSWCTAKTAITSSTSSSIKDYTYEVVDRRTNEKYWIRKFGSLCWMVENLYMPSKQAITSSDTNMTAATYTMPTSSTSGFNDNSKANIYSSVRRRTSDSGNNDGSYFTWVAAKVGVNSTGTNNDVCPKNWRMPTNTEQGTVDTVAELGGSINNFYANSTGAAVSPVLPGLYNYSDPRDAGSYALWWSSTQNNTDNAYRLGSDSSSLNNTGGISKLLGCSVRCVLPAA